MEVLESLNSGLAGAVALTAVHEVARRKVSDAPRMDLLGQRAIARISNAAFGVQPYRSDLQELALAGDITTNSLYYSLVGLGRRETAVARGTALGIAAGVGAVVLPGFLGLDPAPSNRTNATRAMTVAWYAIGGLVAGSVFRLLSSR